MIKLNLGAGPLPRAGWVNIDLFPPKDIPPEVEYQQGDLRHLTQFEDNTVDMIRCHHALEHVPWCDVSPALREWHRVLKAGGTVEIKVPDLAEALRRYLAAPTEEWERFVSSVYGAQVRAGDAHQGGFSLEQLQRLLMRAGLKPFYASCDYVSEQHPLVLIRAQKARPPRVLYITRGGIETCSSRLRAYNIVPYLSSAVIAETQEQRVQWPEYDIIHFQKQFNPQWVRDIAHAAHDAGKVVGLDMDDYVWSDEEKVARLAEMIGYCDYVTSHGEELPAQIEAKFGVECVSIRGGYALEQYKRREPHSVVEMPTLVWWGYAERMDSLKGIMCHLAQLAQDGVAFRLKVINQRAVGPETDAFPVECVKWRKETHQEEIRQCDIGLNPKGITRRSWAKNPHKTAECWLLGLPCVSYHTDPDWYAEIKDLVESAELRQERAEVGYVAAQHWDAKLVAEEWARLFREAL